MKTGDRTSEVLKGGQAPSTAWRLAWRRRVGTAVTSPPPSIPCVTQCLASRGCPRLKRCLPPLEFLPLVAICGYLQAKTVVQCSKSYFGGVVGVGRKPGPSRTRRREGPSGGSSAPRTPYPKDAGASPGPKSWWTVSSAEERSYAVMTSTPRAGSTAGSQRVFLRRIRSTRPGFPVVVVREDRTEGEGPLERKGREPDSSGLCPRPATGPGPRANTPSKVPVPTAWAGTGTADPRRMQAGF